MMQRHLSFHRQLSHTINFDVPDLDLKAISVTSQPDPSSGSSSQLSADVSPCADHSTGNGNHSTRDGSDWCGTAAPSTAGRLYLTLRYDLKLSLLIVRLIRAENLPPKDFSGTSDPYVRLSLFPERKARHQTKLHRKTLNPVFEETFSFPVSVGSLRDRVLQLSVYDFDRFSRHDLIGVAVVRNLFENIEPTEEHLYQLDIVNIAVGRRDIGKISPHRQSADRDWHADIHTHAHTTTGTNIRTGREIDGEFNGRTDRGDTKRQNIQRKTRTDTNGRRQERYYRKFKDYNMTGREDEGGEKRGHESDIEACVTHCRVDSFRPKDHGLCHHPRS